MLLEPFYSLDRCNLNLISRTHVVTVLHELLLNTIVTVVVLTLSFSIRIRNNDWRFSTNTACYLVQEIGILSAIRTPVVELEEVAEELLHTRYVYHRHNKEHELREAIPDQLAVHEVERNVSSARACID